MATITLILDMRRPNSKGHYPIKLRLTHNSKNTSIRSGISIDSKYWSGAIDKAVSVMCPNSKSINSEVETLYFKYSNTLRELEHSGVINTMTVTDIKNTVKYKHEGKQHLTFISFYKQFMARKQAANTVDVYQHTLTKIGQFAEKTKHPGTWDIAEINIEWLNRFEFFLRTQHIGDTGEEVNGIKKLKTNGIAIHFRNIRAVINAAIDEELTTHYPFRKFKIKKEETAKRSITVEQVRILRDYACEAHQTKYRDMFMLMVYLIGVNAIDLFSATELQNGRFEFRRSKTGRLFSVKVEPEAQMIIDKYKGTDHLIDVLDYYANYKDFAHRMNHNLRTIGEVERKGLGGKKSHKPMFPLLTTNWARHTWATLAAELDIPDETISMALGHSSGNRVTNIYINRNRKKVDDANRKVLDYLAGISNTVATEKPTKESETK